MREKQSIENPEYAAEWDYEKNNGLHPDGFTGGSAYRAWWKCKQGHSWSAVIYSRFPNGSRCPYCTNKRATPGVNDLQTINPELAVEWDQEKNDPLQVYEVSGGSVRMAWRKCSLGHSWRARIYSRHLNGSGCPYCTYLKAYPGFNDLATTHPDIAKEWHPDKNGSLRPEQFLAGSYDKVWWMCAQGHEWQARIYSRKTRGCPRCAGLVLVVGVNDLQTVSPFIAEQWDYAKNGKLTPERIAASDKNKTIWWRCKRGHSWQATIQNRMLGKGCPYCCGRVPMRTRLVK